MRTHLLTSTAAVVLPMPGAPDMSTAFSLGTDRPFASSGACRNRLFLHPRTGVSARVSETETRWGSAARTRS